MSRPSQVVLVGLMGAGKTTVGALVARTLDWQFADTDAVVATLAGKSVAEIFENDGEARFRLAELAALDALLDDTSPRVIATGGGIVSTQEARQRLEECDDSVLTIWLDVSPSAAVARITNPKTRPLLEGNPIGRLQVIASERNDWYEQVSDIRIAVDRKTVSQVAAEIIDSLGGDA